MNVMVTGASGLLGRAVVAEFKRNSWKVLGLALTRARDDLISIDLKNIEAVAKMVREYKPHAIVHLAGTSNPKDVDGNEKAHYNLNVNVSADLARMASEIQAVFVFISSDYVFDGENNPHGEDQIPNPLNSFGRLKHLAEKKIIENYPGSCIIRTSILYGGEETVTESVVSRLIPRILSIERRFILDDSHIRYPTHVNDFSKIIYNLVQKKIEDNSIEDTIFHWAGEEPLSEFDTSVLIARALGRPHRHLSPSEHIISYSYQRPANAQLRCGRLGHIGIIGNETPFAGAVHEYEKFFQ